MADDADFAPLVGFESFEGLHYEVEACLVEVSEALVDEEGAYGEAAGGDLCECECECEAYDEGLAAAEGACVAALVEHVAVGDFEDEGAYGVAKLVARRELAQACVGALYECAEGEALCELSEALAVGTAEEAVQSSPFE